MGIHVFFALVQNEVFLMIFGEFLEFCQSAKVALARRFYGRIEVPAENRPSSHIFSKIMKKMMKFRDFVISSIFRGLEQRFWGSIFVNFRFLAWFFVFSVENFRRFWAILVQKSDNSLGFRTFQKIDDFTWFFCDFRNAPRKKVNSAGKYKCLLRGTPNSWKSWNFWDSQKCEETLV